MCNETDHEPIGVIGITCESTSCEPTMCLPSTVTGHISQEDWHLGAMKRPCLSIPASEMRGQDSYSKLSKQQATNVRLKQSQQLNNMGFLYFRTEITHMHGLR